MTAAARTCMAAKRRREQRVRTVFKARMVAGNQGSMKEKVKESRKQATDNIQGTWAVFNKKSSPSSSRLAIVVSSYFATSQPIIF